jgi:hypothetical protein
VDLWATLTWRGRTKPILAALDAAGAREGRVLVLGSPGLARLLARRGRDVATGAVAGPLPFGDGELAGVVAVTRDEPRDEWQRVVRAGGALVLVGAAPEHEVGRRALCAGLTDLRATLSGRTVIMSGRVWRPRAK